MESEILKIASSQGLWAVLTVVLIFYILKAQENRDKKQEEREGNYQQVILKLTEKLNIIDDVQKNVNDIKSCICKEINQA